MASKDIVVIGASAGGVEALTHLCSLLPEGLPAALFVVMHLPATAPSVLPKILNRAGPLPAHNPASGEVIRRGKIYVAPPGKHMLISGETIHLSQGPSENGHRPAIDALFRTAAHSYGERVLGVVLSGMLSDGAHGLRAISVAGGAALAQDPNEALFSPMPESALTITPGARALPVEQIAAEIVKQANGAGSSPPQASPPETTPPPLGPENEERRPTVDDQTRFERDEDNTPRMLITCPDCGGVLSEDEGLGRPLGYHCHVGHRYSLEGLIENHAQMVERALWSAHRVLMERSMLTSRLAAQADEGNRRHLAQRYQELSQQAAREADIIRQLIEQATLASGTYPENNKQEE